MNKTTNETGMRDGETKRHKGNGCYGIEINQKQQSKCV